MTTEPPEPPEPPQPPETIKAAEPLFVFDSLVAPKGAAATRHDINVVLDIPVRLSVELGRSRINVKHLLQLTLGSVVELDGLAGEPMDVLVNDCLIAQGEIVVVNDKFGIRLTDIATPADRLRSLKK